MDAERRKNAKKAFKAFTLNELLFALLALILLLCVVVPYLADIRRSLMQSSCVDNLMTLYKLNSLYAEDFGRYAPSAADATRRWHGELNENPAKRPDETQSPFRHYLGKRNGYFKACPAFEKVVDASVKAKERGGNGYGYNENVGSLRVVRKDLDLWDPACKAAGLAPKELGRPKDVLMFSDTATRVDGNGDPDPYGTEAENAFCVSYDTYNRGRPAWGTPEPTMHFRHGGAAMTAWCDGRISAELPQGTKGEWFKNQATGFIGTRTYPLFVPELQLQDEEGAK